MGASLTSHLPKEVRKTPTFLLRQKGFLRLAFWLVHGIEEKQESWCPWKL